jgi:hypothetical protein
LHQWLSKVTKQQSCFATYLGLTVNVVASIMCMFGSLPLIDTQCLLEILFTSTWYLHPKILLSEHLSEYLQQPKVALITDCKKCFAKVTVCHWTRTPHYMTYFVACCLLTLSYFPNAFLCVPACWLAGWT